MPERQRGSAAELLQPPVVYLLGFGALILASPLEDLLGDAVARFLACVAFNAVLYRVLRLRLPLAFRPSAVLCGAALGVLLALPSVPLAELSMPGTLLALVVVVDAAWEELLFRGLAFDLAHRRYGQWGALALSS